MDDEIDRTERLLRLSVPLGSIDYRFVSGMLRSAGNCYASEYFRSLAARYVTQRVSFSVRRIDRRFCTYLLAIKSLAIFARCILRCVFFFCAVANEVQPTRVDFPLLST